MTTIQRHKQERGAHAAADGSADPSRDADRSAAAERAEAMRAEQAMQRAHSPNEISEETVEEIAADAEAHARPRRPGR